MPPGLGSKISTGVGTGAPAELVTEVAYESHDAAYHLGVEILDAEELRRRVASDPGRGYERVDFQCIIFVRAGAYTHTVDFEPLTCAAGSVVLVGPGQVHHFGPPSAWDGWILIADAQHVPDLVQLLPSHLRLAPECADAVIEQFERMVLDVRSAVGGAELDQLLGVQTQVMVRRLALGQLGAPARDPVDAAALARYRDFRRCVDRHHRRWHHVAPYAQELGCSAKSLNRACRSTAALTAKRVIVDRIVLEAKRLLAHTSDPVASISRELGFDEPTNFVKFFRRATGTTPGRFRTRTVAAASPRSPAAP